MPESRIPNHLFLEQFGESVWNETKVIMSHSKEIDSEARNFHM